MMTRGQNFWTEESTRDFHTSIGSIVQRNRILSDPRIYSHSDDPSSGHTLSFQDEFRMANNLAILARWSDYDGTISAVTVQEQDGHLVVRVSSNSEPKKTILTGLKDLMDIVSKVSADRKHPVESSLLLSSKILQLGQERILDRIKPPWRRQRKNAQPSLKDRLVKRFGRSCQAMSVPEEFRSHFQELVEVLGSLDRKPGMGGMELFLEHVVTRCAGLAEIGGRRSLEVNLQHLGLPPEVCQSREVRQVDKLARYRYMCRDFVRLSRNKAYRLLLRSIDVVPLEAYERVRRPHTQCAVHAEMQQLLYYEKNPPVPSVRAIGCCKLACYLCDLVIHEHGRYRIAGAHGRIYEKWTLPDVDWMTPAQATDFQLIIRKMTLHLRAQLSSRGPPRIYPCESVAGVRSSTASPITTATTKASTASSTTASEATITGPSPQARADRRQVAALPIVVSSADLPFATEVSIGKAPIHLEIDRLRLLFEFEPASTGSLAIRRAEASSALLTGDGLPLSFEASSIPSDEEVKVAADSETKTATFYIRRGPGTCIELSFHWGDVE